MDPMCRDISMYYRFPHRNKSITASQHASHTHILAIYHFVGLFAFIIHCKAAHIIEGTNDECLVRNNHTETKMIAYLQRDRVNYYIVR